MKSKEEIIALTKDLYNDIWGISVEEAYDFAKENLSESTFEYRFTPHEELHEVSCPNLAGMRVDTIIKHLEDLPADATMSIDDNGNISFWKYRLPKDEEFANDVTMNLMYWAKIKHYELSDNSIEVSIRNAETFKKSLNRELSNIKKKIAGVDKQSEVYKEYKDRIEKLLK